MAMTEKKSDPEFGYEGDLWEEFRGDPVEPVQDAAYSTEQGHDDVPCDAMKDAKICRNMGLLVFIVLFLSFTRAGVAMAALAAMFAAAGIKSGGRARGAGLDDKSVRIGMFLCRVAQAVAVVYVILIVIAVVIFFAFLAIGMPALARALP